MTHTYLLFTGVFSKETIERYVEESTERFNGSRLEEFVPLLAGRYARERLQALAQVEGHVTKEVPEVLFVCVHNAGRSQMAAGLLAKLGEGRVRVRTAGSEPAEEINLDPGVSAAATAAGLFTFILMFGPAPRPRTCSPR